MRRPIDPSSPSSGTPPDMSNLSLNGLPPPPSAVPRLPSDMSTSFHHNPPRFQTQVSDAVDEEDPDYEHVQHDQYDRDPSIASSRNGNLTPTTTASASPPPAGPGPASSAPRKTDLKTNAIVDDAVAFARDPIPGAPWAFIAIMGVTGSGKSSFIKTITQNEDIIVGHGIESCTAEMQAYTCHIDGYNVNLIDTPGFNDTFRTDTEILQELADWLVQTYRGDDKQCLNGIIYLHDIAKTRMEGSAMLNLKMFRQLCGKKPLKNVILATSFWDSVEAQRGHEREKQLRETESFWGDMIAGGCRMERYTTRQSGLDIVSSLLNKPAVALKIQTELVDEEKTLVDTAAGQTVNAELLRLEKKHKRDLERVKDEMEDAIRERDEEYQALLTSQKAKLDREIDKLRDQQQQLQYDRRADRRRNDNEVSEVITGMAEENKRLRAELDESRMRLLSFDEAVATLRVKEGSMDRHYRDIMEAKIMELQQDPRLNKISQDGKPKKKKKGTGRYLFMALRAVLPVATSILIGVPIHWPSITGLDDDDDDDDASC